MNKHISIYYVIHSVSCCLLVSCNSDYSAGKKKGYFHIDFPEKKYQPFDQPGYPYTFEYPVYATVNKGLHFF